MSVEALGFLLTAGVRVPYQKEKISELATRSVLSNLAWHSNQYGLVWVSDRTQEREIEMSRSHIGDIRNLLEQEGWLKFTGERKQKGVKVYQLCIPNFSFSGANSHTTTQTVSGLVSGVASGVVSGVASGVVANSKYEIKEIEKNINETQIKNSLLNVNPIPENVRELINKSKRSRGVEIDNTEISLGQAVENV